MVILRVNAVTRTGRGEMIARVRSALGVSGAWVLDVKQFSNVSVCFSFEIPAGRVEQLLEELVAADLSLTSESNDLFARFIRAVEPREEAETTDVAGTLQITFIHNEPDLKIEVPRIPG